MKRTVQEHIATYAASLGVPVPEVMRLYVLSASIRAALGALILPKPRK
jgi:hypothetical protein